MTSWSKLGTRWQGVSLDTLFSDVETAADYALVRSYGGYTTNLLLARGHDAANIRTERFGPSFSGG